jgi:MYXO-CTERM domain-containing protein
VKNVLLTGIVTVVLAWASVVAADSMPACPEGQHLKTNPTSPGAMHHAGGQCVENESSCSASGSTGGVLAGVVLLGLAVWHRRRR